MAGMFRLGSLRKTGVGNGYMRIEVCSVRWCSDDSGGFVSRLWRRYALQNGHAQFDCIGYALQSKAPFLIASGER